MRVRACWPASRRAAIVQALRHAGATLLAQNNMTEFAYGALGLNRWHGTPLTPLMADAPRVAGGSSSGGAVAVALGMATLALGSDTSGSARIPAAFCGVAGFKPSRGRYPDAGMAICRPASTCRASWRRMPPPACAWIARWCMNLKTMAWRARHRTGTRRA